MKEKTRQEESKQQEHSYNSILDTLLKFHRSVRSHLRKDYRNKHFIKLIFSAVLFLTIAVVIVSLNNPYDNNNLKQLIIWIYTFIAAYFWHYSYWSYQNGVIDTFSKNFIHIGSIVSVIWRVLVHNCLILFWIFMIAPFSGFKTWRKAVKHNKELYVLSSTDKQWD